MTNQELKDESLELAASYANKKPHSTVNGIAITDLAQEYAASQCRDMTEEIKKKTEWEDHGVDFMIHIFEKDFDEISAKYIK